MGYRTIVRGFAAEPEEKTEEGEKTIPPVSFGKKVVGWVARNHVGIAVMLAIVGYIVISVWLAVKDAEIKRLELHLETQKFLLDHYRKLNDSLKVTVEKQWFYDPEKP